MFCGHCGTNVDDNAKYCPSCGAPVQPTQSTQSFEQNPLPPYTEPAQVNGRTWKEIKQLGYIIGSDGKSYGIGWMKFLLYFSFFAGAVTSLFSALNILTGMQYGSDAALVYEAFPAMKAVDIIFGLLTILYSAGLIFVRYQISGLKRTAMQSYLAIFIFGLIVGYGYLLAASIVVGTPITSALGETLGHDVASFIMFIINYAVYFKHRSSVFVN